MWTQLLRWLGQEVREEEFAREVLRWKQMSRSHMIPFISPFLRICPGPSGPSTYSGRSLNLDQQLA